MVHAILARIGRALVDGDRVYLRDFGTFSTKELPGRQARNPRTGKATIVPARKHVHFKPGKAMRVRLNLEKVEAEQDAGRLLQAS